MAFIGLSKPPMGQVGALVQPSQLAPIHTMAGLEAGQHLVVFLRHVGCPFAEHSVRRLRVWADVHPLVQVHVVSHGAVQATADWLDAIGGSGRLHVISDLDRSIYRAWGVGYSGMWHFLGLRSLLGVIALWTQGIRNRSASGTRWQRAAMFLLNDQRVVWRHLPASAQEFVLPPAALLAQPSRTFVNNS